MGTHHKRLKTFQCVQQRKKKIKKFITSKLQNLQVVGADGVECVEENLLVFVGNLAVEKENKNRKSNNLLMLKHKT